MFQSDITQENQLFAFSYRDLVPETSDVWLYIDLFDSLDLFNFDSRYSSQGQEAKEPRLMLRTIFYALTHGITSGRRLADACRHDSRFIVLSGARMPDRRTFDRFLERHTNDLDKLFIAVVRLAQKMQLVKLGRVAIDGSKFKAAADKSMMYEKMDRAMEYIREELAALKKDLTEKQAKETGAIDDELEEAIKVREVRLEKIRKAKNQIDKEFDAQITSASKKKKRKPKASKALHDVEALAFGASAKFSFGYNAQVVVDEQAQIIVAADLWSSSNDSKALPSMLDQVASNCGKMPVATLADAGYQSLANIEALQQRNSDVFIALGQEYKSVPEHALEQIRKGEGDRSYFCMNNKELHLASKSKDGYLVFKIDKAFCSQCPLSSQCRFFGKKFPQVPDDEPRKVMKNYLEKTRQPEWQDTYRMRKAIVEPIFGNIKNKGIRILVRGKQKVRLWWRIACTAHNIEKIIPYQRVSIARSG